MFSLKIKSYLKIMWTLLKTEVLIFNKGLINNYINTIMWVGTTILVFAYVFPQLGMQEGFGPFYAIGLIPSCSFWQVWTYSVTFVADMDGNRTITYPLTLPIPNWLVFATKGLSYTYHSTVVSIIVLPLSKILLWNSLDLSNFCIFKFLIIFLLTNLSMGFFALFIASLVKSMGDIDKIAIRYLFPMWFFGCSQFSYKTLQELSPLLAKIAYLNPLTYVMEGTRIAILGQSGYIPFSLCVVMTIIFTIIFGFIGIAKFKKRLDFV